MSAKSNNVDFKIDPKKWGWKLLSYWWLFVLIFCITLPVGQAYLRYTVPQYIIKSKLLIKGVSGSDGLSELSILSEGLGLDQGGKDLLNEMEILRSRPVMMKVVEELGTNITYSRIGRFRDTEFYKTTPLIVRDYTLVAESKMLSFFVEMRHGEEFRFMKDEGDEGEMHVFGQQFQNQFGSFIIEKNTAAKFIPGTYRINIMAVENVANSYKKKLQIEVVGGGFRSSSILDISLIDPTPEKAKDILDKLIEVYNEEEILDKTEVLKNTVSFVDSRITNLTHELDSIESNIQGFKSNNSIITETAASSLDYSLTEIRASISKQAELELEKELLKALENNLTRNPESLIPTNVSGDAPALAGLIDEYNALFLQKKKLAQTVSDTYPILVQYEGDLEDLRGLITRSLKNLQANLEIPLSQVKREIEALKKELTVVPAVEKSLIEKLRMQSIKENLYLLLLQKKEETELSMAISTANTRVIESARSSAGAIFPNRKLTRLASVVLGFFIPLLVIILRELLTTSVQSEDVLKGLTTVPVIGRIAHYDKKMSQRLLPGERSVRAEMFKLLRTNLNFSNIKNETQVLEVTSSMSGEGKSITAINLAITIGISGKKVVLVDMDLRKPKLENYLGVASGTGVTNYLIGESELSDILNVHGDYENLSYISSGPIPPNPAELIMSDRSGRLIDKLKQQFDYIIIDCPPIGVVSDGLLLREHLTKMLYVVRHRKTKHESVVYMEEQYRAGELVNPNIIINDIKVGSKASAYGGYATGYGGGYYVKGKR